MTSWQPMIELKPLDPARGESALAAVDVVAIKGGKTATPLPANKLTDAMRTFVRALAASSPYLDGLITRDPEFAHRVFTEDPAALSDEILTILNTEAPAAHSLDALMAMLRRAKAQVALLTAATDVAGVWDLHMATGYLSRFAEAALDLGVARLLHDAMIRGDLAWPRGKPEPATMALAKDTGLTILAMGKLGGRELNYSSDLDIMVFYDETVVDYRGRRTVSDCFVKLTSDARDCICVRP